MRLTTIRVNGVKRQVISDESRRLADLIRDDLRLTGTKKGCLEGHCGVCSVIIDGNAVRSCQVALRDLAEGSQITTIEGIGTLEDPHPIQKAFAAEGAIQCGYCTPGMIVVAKALLDQNQQPSEAEIREAFKHNLCRCTGYDSIIRAVQLASALLRGEASDRPLALNVGGDLFGQKVPRPSALAKATGTVQFGDDLDVPSDTLHLKIVRSPHHHAWIRGIDPAEAEQMPGVVGVLTADDIPGENRVWSDPQPQYGDFVLNERVLCDEKVSAWGSPVAVVVAETEEQAAAAVDKVRVDYEVLPTYRTPQESLAEGAVSIVPEYDSNKTFTAYLRKDVKGKAEVEEILHDLPYVVEQEFVTARQSHLTLEPDNAIAFIDDEDRLTVMSKSVSIHSHMRELSRILGIGTDRMRWIENQSGGSFGFKTRITCEAYVALAALKYRRPCKIVYSMAENILTVGTRSRFWAKAKVGADNDGHIKGLLFEVAVDCGANDNMGSQIVYKCNHYFGGPHRIPKAYGAATIVFTNDQRANACCRGLGATPTQLVSEVLLDMLADKAAMDPLEFRYLNAWRPGDVGNWGSETDCYPYPAMLEHLRPLYQAAKARAKEQSTCQKKRGVGVAGAFFGCGLDEIPDTSFAWAELNPDDSVTIHASWADPGQGADIGIVTIASRALDGLPPEKIRFVTRDTDITPNSGPSLASRQTTVTGNAIRRACEALIKAMKDNGCPNYADMKARNLPLLYIGKHVCNHTLSDKNSQGRPVENWQYNLQMAEVEVDGATGKVKVLKMTTVVDVGVIHNRLVMEGQAVGAANMGTGIALWEEVLPGETDTLLKAGIPNFLNSPPVECHFLETYRERGTYGGVACGEAVIMATAPAILNAIYDACGARLSVFPAKPERVLEAIAENDPGKGEAEDALADAKADHGI